MLNYRVLVIALALFLFPAFRTDGQTKTENGKGMIYNLEEESVSYQAKHNAHIITIYSPGGTYMSEQYPPLAYTSNDVIRVAEALRFGGSLSEYQTHTEDCSSSRLGILMALSDLNQIKPGDLIIIIMSGHGAIVGEDYAFVASDGFVYGREIWSSLSQMESNGLNVIVFLDTCYSGFMKRNIPMTISGNGRIALFCSCSAKEQSFEDPSINMSRFSYSLATQFYGMGERYKGERMSIEFLRSEVYLTTSEQNPSLLLFGDFDSYHPFKNPVTYSELVSNGNTAYSERKYLESLECYSKAKDIKLMFNKGYPRLLHDEIKKVTDAIQKEVYNIYVNSSSEGPSATIQKLLRYQRAYEIWNYDENRSKFNLYCFEMYDQLQDMEKRDDCLLEGLRTDQDKIGYNERKEKIATAREAHKSGDFKTEGDIYREFSDACNVFKYSLLKKSYFCYRKAGDRHIAFLTCMQLWEKNKSEWADEIETYFGLPEYYVWKEKQNYRKSKNTHDNLLFPFHNYKTAVSIGNAKGIIPISAYFYGGERDIHYSIGLKYSFRRNGYQPSGENDPYIDGCPMLMGGIGYSLVSFMLGFGLADVNNTVTYNHEYVNMSYYTHQSYSIFGSNLTVVIQPQFTLFTPAIFSDRIQFFGSIGYNFLPKYKPLCGWEFSFGIAYNFDIY